METDSRVRDWPVVRIRPAFHRALVERRSRDRVPVSQQLDLLLEAALHCTASEGVEAGD